MTDGAVDARGALRAIGRRWRVVVALTALGAVVGLVYAPSRPSWQTARSLVLLPPTASASSGRPARDVDTQVLIASSAPVLAGAARAINTPLNFKAQVDVSALTTDILAIRARAHSSKDAIALANAVAHSYVDYSTGALSDDARAAVGALQDKAAQLRAKSDDLEAQIADHTARLAPVQPGTPDAVSESAVLARLQARLTDTAQQVDGVNARIGDTELGSALANNGTRVLERATAASGPSALRVIQPTFLAVLFGFLLGVVVALWINSHDRRLRSRDDIAHAVGAPVVASLTATPIKSRAWSKWLRGYEPSVLDEWLSRQMFQRLNRQDRDGPREITLVTLAGDANALVVTAKVAVCSASIGERTILSVATRHPSATSLRSICNSSEEHAQAIRPNLSMHDGPVFLESTTLDADVVIAVVVAEGVIELPGWSANSGLLICVTAGFATRDAIVAVTLAAANAGHPPNGAIVVNPDPHDESGGRLVQDPVTAPTAPPTRITGIAGRSA
ncbi:MAG: hypothetical protein WD271_05430 [Acidimicrobiia bacterium]